MPSGMYRDTFTLNTVCRRVRTLQLRSPYLVVYAVVIRWFGSCVDSKQSFGVRWNSKLWVDGTSLLSTTVAEFHFEAGRWQIEIGIRYREREINSESLRAGREVCGTVITALHSGNVLCFFLFLLFSILVLPFPLLPLLTIDRFHFLYLFLYVFPFYTLSHCVHYLQSSSVFFSYASSSPFLFLLLSKFLFIFTSASTECCSTVSAQWWLPTAYFVTLLRRTASVISKCSESVEWLQNLGVVASILKRSSMRTDRVLC